MAAILVVSPQSVYGQVENPQSGSLALEGLVDGPPPQEAAVITTPNDGQVITSLPTPVEGTCPDGSIVKIFKNEVFAGSTICDGGRFALQIDLFSGENTLLARVYNALDEAGPDSKPVTVTYRNPSLTGGDGVDQLIIISRKTFIGGNPGQELSFELGIRGGSGPYGVSINWGDGKETVLTRRDSGFFTASHTYERPGTYKITIRIGDDNQRQAFLQLVSIINGEAADQTQEKGDSGLFIREKILIWPLILLAILVPVAFWLGRKYEDRKYGIK